MADKRKYTHYIGMEFDKASWGKAEKDMKGSINAVVAEMSEEVGSIFNALKDNKDVDLSKLADAMQKISSHTGHANDDFVMLQGQLQELTKKIEAVEEGYLKSTSAISQKLKTTMRDVRGLTSNLDQKIAGLMAKIDAGQVRIELTPFIQPEKWKDKLQKAIRDSVGPIEVDIKPSVVGKMDNAVEKAKNIQFGSSDEDATKDIEKIKERFKNVKDAITEERKKLDKEAKEWRKAINKTLELEFKFKGLGQRALQDLTTDIKEVIDEVNGELVDHPIILHTNIEELAQKIEERLNKIKIDNITVGDIKATGNLNIDGGTVIGGGRGPSGGSASITPPLMSKKNAQQFADAIIQGLNGTQKGTGSTVPKKPPAQKATEKREREKEKETLAEHVASLYKNLTGDLNKEGSKQTQKQSLKNNFPVLHQALQKLVANPNDQTLIDVLESSDFANFAKEWGNPKGLIPIIAQAIARGYGEKGSAVDKIQVGKDIKNINSAYANAVKHDKFNITEDTSPNLHKAITLLYKFGATDQKFSDKVHALTELALGLDDTQIATEGSKSAQIFNSVKELISDIIAFKDNDTKINRLKTDKDGRPIFDENGKNIYETVPLVDILKESKEFRNVMSVLSSVDSNNITKDTIRALMKTANIGDFFDQYGSYITRTVEDDKGKKTTFSPIDATFDNKDLLNTVYEILFRETDLSGEVAPLLKGASKKKFDFTQELLTLKDEFKAQIGEDYNKEGVASAHAAGKSAQDIMKWMLEYAKIVKHISKLHNTKTNPNRLSDESLSAQAEWISQQKVSKNDLNEMIDSMTSESVYRIKDMQSELNETGKKIKEYNTAISVGQQNLNKFKDSEKDSKAYREQAAVIAKDVRARDALTKQYQELEAKIEEAREPERQAILKLLGMTEANIVDPTETEGKLSQILNPVFGAIADYNRKKSVVDDLKDQLTPSMKEALDQEGDYNVNLADLLVKEIAKATKGNTQQGKQIRDIFKANGVDLSILKTLQKENLSTEEQWKIIENGIFDNTNVNFDKLISDLAAGSEKLKRGYPRFIDLLQYAERYSDAAWKVDSSRLSAMGRIDDAVKTVRFGETSVKDSSFMRKVDVKPSDIIRDRLNRAQELVDIKTPAYELMLKQEELMAERTQAQLERLNGYTEAQIQQMEQDNTSVLNTSEQRAIFESMSETQGITQDYRDRIKTAIQLFDDGKTIDQQVTDAKEKQVQINNALIRAENALLDAIQNEEDKAIAKSYISGEMLSTKQQKRFEELGLPQKAQYDDALKASDSATKQLDVVQKMKDAVSINGLRELYAQQKQSVENIKSYILSFTEDVRRLEDELYATLADEEANPDKKYSYVVEEDVKRRRREGGYDEIAAGYQFVVVDEKGNALKVGSWSGAEGADKHVNDGGFFYNQIVKEFSKWIDKEGLTAGFSPATAKALGMPTYVDTAVAPPVRYTKAYREGQISRLDRAIEQAANELENLSPNINELLKNEMGRIVFKDSTIKGAVQTDKDIQKQADNAWSVVRKKDIKDNLEADLRIAEIKAEEAKTEVESAAQLLEIKKKYAEENPKQQLPEYESFIEQDTQSVNTILRTILEDARTYSQSMWLEYDNKIQDLETQLNQTKPKRAQLVDEIDAQKGIVEEAEKKYGKDSAQHTSATARLTELYDDIREIDKVQNALKAQIEKTKEQKELRDFNDIREFDKKLVNAIDLFTNTFDKEAYEYIKQIWQQFTPDPNDAVNVAQQSYDIATQKDEQAKQKVQDITDKLAIAEQELSEVRQAEFERLKAKQGTVQEPLTDDEKKALELYDKRQGAAEKYESAMDVEAKTDEDIAKKEAEIEKAKAEFLAIDKEFKNLLLVIMGTTEEELLANAQDAMANRRTKITALIEELKTEKEKLSKNLTEDLNIVEDSSSLRNALQLATSYLEYYNKQENILSDRLDSQQVDYNEAKDDPDVSPAYLEQLSAEMNQTRETRVAIREEQKWMKDQVKAIAALLDSREQALRDKYNSTLSGEKVAPKPATQDTGTSTSRSTDNETPTTELSSSVKDLLVQALTGAGFSDGALMLASLPEDIATETTLRQVLRALTEPYNKEIMDIEEQLKAEYAKLAALDNKDNTPTDNPPSSGGSTPPTPAKNQPRTKGSASGAQSDKVEDELLDVKKRTIAELRNRLRTDKNLTTQQKDALTNAIKLINEENTLDEKIIAAEKVRLDADNTLMSIGTKKKGVGGKVKSAYIKQALGEELTEKEQQKINNLKSVEKIAAAKAYGEAGANVAHAITEYVDSVVGNVAQEVGATEPKKETGKDKKTIKAKQTAKAETPPEKEVQQKVAQSLKEKYSHANKTNLALIEQLVNAQENDASLKDYEKQKIQTVVKYLNSSKQLATRVKALQEIDATEQQLEEVFKSKKDRTNAKEVAKALAKKQELSAEQQEWYDKYPAKGPKAKAINAYSKTLGKIDGDADYQRNAFALAEKILNKTAESPVGENASKAEEVALTKLENKLGAIEQRLEVIAQKVTDPNTTDDEKQSLLAEVQQIKDGMSVARGNNNISQQSGNSIKDTIGQSENALYAAIIKSNEETRALVRIFREHSFAIKDGKVTDVRVGNYGHTPAVSVKGADTIGHMHPDNTMFSPGDVKATQALLRNNKSLNTDILITQKGKIVWNNLQSVTEQELNELYTNLMSIANWLSKFNNSIPNIEDYYSTIAAEMFKNAGMDVSYYTRNKKGGYTNVSRSATGNISSEIIQSILTEAKNDSNNKDILNNINPKNYFHSDQIPLGNVSESIQRIQSAITQGMPLIQYLEDLGEIIAVLGDFAPTNANTSSLLNRLVELDSEIAQNPSKEWHKDQRLIDIFGGYDDMSDARHNQILSAFTPIADPQKVEDALTGGDGKVELAPEVKPEAITESVNQAEAQADTTVKVDPEIPAGEIKQEITEAEQTGETVAEIKPETSTVPDERTQIQNNIAQLEQKLADAKNKGGYLATEAKQDAIIAILKGGLKVNDTTVKGDEKGSGAKKKQKDDGDDTPKVKYTAQENNAIKRKAKMEAEIKALYDTNDIDGFMQQQTADASAAWQNYNALHEAFINKERDYLNSGEALTEAQKNELVQDAAELKVVEDQLNKQISRAKKIRVTEIDRKKKEDGVDIQAQMKAFAGIDDSAKYQWKFNEATQTATYILEGANNSIKEMSISYEALTGSLVKGEKKQIATFSNMEKFIQGIKAKWVEVARYMASFASLYRVFGEMRRGVQYIREIDSALTELKKVTNETDATYKKFLNTMASSASIVGSTVTELTQSAADWRRLGYSIEDAGILAQNTAILMNVSEFDNVNAATEALISSLQAFGYEASNSIEIVDKLNIVGKFIARR